MTKVWRRLIGGVVQIPINSGGPQVYLAEDSNGHVLAERISGTTTQNITFGADTVVYVRYIYNRLYRGSIQQFPQDRWTRERANVKHL